MQVSDLGLDMCNAHEDVRKGTKRRFVTCKFRPWLGHVQRARGRAERN